MTSVERERRLSVTITGPEGMLGAMAKLLRDEGYTVIGPGGRPLLLAAERAVVAAMAEIELPYVVAAARNEKSMWHAPAMAELVRRGAFDELAAVRERQGRKASKRKARRR